DAHAAREFLHSLTAERARPAAIPELLSERHVPEYPRWRELILQATRAIAAAEMEKVVLARATDLRFAAPLDAWSITAASR
ncbi:isochorismate synthase MenF, partial [Bacillus sp. SRB_28]